MIKSFTHSTTMIRYDIIASNNQPFLSMSTSYSQKNLLVQGQPFKRVERVILKKIKIYYRFLRRQTFLHRFPSKCFLNLLNRFLRKKTQPLCIPSSRGWFLNINVLKKSWTMQHNIMFLSFQINATILFGGQSYDYMYLIGVAITVLKILCCSELNQINYKINAPEEVLTYTCDLLLVSNS